MSTMNPELRGTSLREDDIRTGKAIVTEWRPKAEYEFDAGVAVGQFLGGLKAGQLLGRRCDACARVVIPPRMFCELCFRRNDAWVQLENTGRVNTFSVSFVNWDASRRTTPQVPAVIDIDGTNPGMGILHLLGEVGESLDEVLARVKVGMPVEAVWKPAEQREGAITDILYFRPVKEGGTAKPAAASRSTAPQEYLTQVEAPRQVHGDWGVYYRYTCGVAGERFFREMKDRGRLVASACPKCKKRFLPPNQYCEDCFVEMTEYAPVEGAGTVQSFTVLHDSLEAQPLPEPVIAAFVQFDGVAGGLLAPLTGVTPADVKIGMRVKPVLETKQPQHAITDLTWAPA